jgi:hypothetical protein
MEKILPDRVVGALAGFVVGYLGAGALIFLGWAVPRELLIPAGIVGAVGGGLVGAYLRRPSEQGGAIARWCAGTAVVVGGISFLAGFVGPLLLHPNSTKAPAQGFLCTGPLGTIVGALLGLVIGAAVAGPSPRVMPCRRCR